MNKKTLAALCTTVFLWGSAFVAIRIAAPHFSPEGLALLRLLIGAVLMLPIAGRHLFRKVEFRWIDIPHIILLATIGISLYHVFLAYGERSVPAGVASFVVGQMPIISALLAWWFYKEKVSFWGCVGLMISVLGVSMIALAGNQEMAFTQGLWAIIGCTVFSGTYNVLIKPLLLRYDPVALSVYIIWASLLCLLPYFPNLIHDVRTAPAADSWVVVYLGVFPTALAYITWSYALAYLPTVKATCWMFMLPLVSCLLGWAVLKEIPDLLTFLGGVIAMGGAILVTLSKHKAGVVSQKNTALAEES